MATSTSFKQQCPSCEALVPIKDTSLVGRKIDCPKCKYRFVVAEPDKPADADGEGNGAPKKPGAKAPATGAKTNGAAAKPAKKRLRDEPEPDETGDEAPAKKGKGGDSNKKMMIGLGFAGVGVVALAVAAFFMFKGDSKPKTAPPKPGNAQQANTNAGEPVKPVEAPKEEKKITPAADPGSLEITNLLPPKTDHVVHLTLREFWNTPLGQKVLAYIPDRYVKARLGLSLKDIDEVIRAESFRPETIQKYGAAWAFNVVHTAEPFDLATVTQALGLKPAKPIKGHEYYLTGPKPDPWLNQLGRLSLTKKPQAAAAEFRKGPIAVHQYNDQTLIFADEVALKEFLDSDRKFEFVQPPLPEQEERGGGAGFAPGGRPAGPGGRPMPPGPARPGGPGGPPGPGGPRGPRPPGGGGGGGSGNSTQPHQAPVPPGPRPPAGPNNPAAGQQGPAGQDKKDDMLLAGREVYMTIDPELRLVLLGLDLPAVTKERVLFKSATWFRTAEKQKPFKQTWNILGWFEEPPRYVDIIGTSFAMKGEDVFALRNNLLCHLPGNARTSIVQMFLTVGPEFSKFFKDVTGIALPIVLDKPKKKKTNQQGGALGPGGAGGMRPPPMGPGAPGGGGMGPRGPGRRGPVAPGLPGGAPGAPRPGGGPGAPGVGNRPPAGGTPQDISNPSDQGSQLEDEIATEDDEEESGIYIRYHYRLAQFKIKLALEKKTRPRMERIVGLVLAGIRGEMDLYGAPSHVHRLGAGIRQLGQKDQRFPQAALFRQPAPKRAGYSWEPDRRISWMAELLPLLGHERLHKEIRRETSWDDQENLFVARALVPEFQDPSYPKTSLYVNYPGVPVDVATTHYVAIAGIGEDAAAEDDKDPEAAKRLGVFGYDRSTPLASLERGASQTAVVIEVPPDSAGPWMAGGGSTVRGVPDAGGIKPFVGPGRKGTYVLMADGSVRFVSSNISPQAFKAMCTIKGKATLKDDEWQPVPEGGMKARPRPKEGEPPAKK
jgi:hypothetical protein